MGHLGAIIKHPLESYPFVINYADRLPGVFVQAGSYTATTISVDGNTETYSDSANSMPAASPGDQLVVSGAANSANNGTFEVGNRSASSITPHVANLTTEAAGASITLVVGTPAKVSSVALTAVRDSDGVDMTGTILASASGTMFDQGRKSALTLQGGVDGESYTVTVQATLSSGASHKFVDTMTIFVRNRADR
jgi:hypothetical protein